MLRTIIGIACCVMAAVASAAEPYPSKPVRMLLPQPPGGTMETIGRALSQQVAQAWGQPIVIDNRSGANGIIAGELTARAIPDGYTLLYTSASLANNQLVHKKPPFDALKDLAPVTQVTTLPGYLVLVNPDLAAKNVKELIELSKKTRVHFGSSGHGNSQHLLGELINARSGAKLVHVPYKGFALIITAVMANEVQVAFGAPLTVVPHMKAGRLRAIGYTGAQRWSGAPEVPTVAESGIADFVYEASWHGIFAPAGTSASIISRIQSEFAKVLQVPGTRQMLTAGGQVPVASTPAEFRKYLHEYFKDTAEQMRIAGVKPE
jgi:tripartite-type tricarboxylate transporter receptor subunit TctC